MRPLRHWAAINVAVVIHPRRSDHIRSGRVDVHRMLVDLWSAGHTERAAASVPPTPRGPNSHWQASSENLKGQAGLSLEDSEVEDRDIGQAARCIPRANGRDPLATLNM